MKKNASVSSVLYLKYRPKDFNQVIGQDHIISVLEASVQKEQIAHAYLFSGSRGTGKTSVARILAEKIGTSRNDLYEIDAASNNSVEQIRELNEAVHTLPFESKYKVYILDEVHMLSKSAFNALLKTLEEPPEHVIFILATTEPEKLPETVISRCENYNFKKPNREMLAKMVRERAKSEGFILEPSSTELIAILSENSFRDAHTILQKVLRASADKKISPEEVEAVTGAPKSELVNQFIEALVLNSNEKGISALNSASQKNVDMKIFTLLALEKARMLLVLKSAPSSTEIFAESISSDDLEFLKSLLKKENFHFDSKSLLSLINAYTLLPVSPIKNLPLELVLFENFENQEK